MLPTTDITGIEIFSEGTHGTDFYSRDDLQAMIDAHGKLGFDPTIKLIEEGHERRVFGAPALGYVSRIYRKGSKLLADLKQVPATIAEKIRNRAYKKLGCEIFWEYKDETTGRVLPRVLKAVTFDLDGVRLDSFADIEQLFEYEFNVQPEDRRMNTNVTELWKKYERASRKIAYEDSLSARSTEFAQEALRYAQEYDTDFPTAVRQLMKLVREHTQQK